MVATTQKPIQPLSENECDIAQTLSNRPSTISLLKGIVGSTFRNVANHKKDITCTQLSLYGQTTSVDRLSQYNKVCGFKSTPFLPATWPHIMAFPLHMKLLTTPSFPYPLAGLVHVKNTITQYRAISIDETLDFICTLSQGKPSPKGVLFDITTEVFSAGSLIWSEVSTNLYKASPPNKNSASMIKQERNRKSLPHYSNKVNWSLNSSKGRMYAKVSGDVNPIHLHNVSAKLFGLKTAIIHGMCSKAFILANLAEDLPDAYTIDVDFKLPLSLPGSAELSWDNSQQNGIDFQLTDRTVSKPYLSGHITPLK